MPKHIINGVTIHTHYDPPPIPPRDCDWSATTDDYDMTDVDEEGHPYSNCPCGYGATESEAIANLLDQLDLDPAAHEPFPGNGWHG